MRAATLSANSALACIRQYMSPVHTKLYVSQCLLIACGAWLICLGVYFIAVRPPLLPEDLRFMGTTLGEIRTAVPSFESWLDKVFNVLGGFMAGTGILTVFIAINIRHRLKATSLAVAATGTLTVGLMSAINITLQSDFRWLLFIPVLVWVASLVFYLTEHSKNAG